MLLRISENFIVNLDEISHVYNSVVYLKNGEYFKLDSTSMKNMNKIAEKFCKDFFEEGSKYG